MSKGLVERLAMFLGRNSDLVGEDRAIHPMCKESAVSNPEKVVTFSDQPQRTSSSGKERSRRKKAEKDGEW